MITLHQYHLSPFNAKIQRMLNFKGIPFEERYWRLGDARDVKGISPSGKLPALEQAGQVVCDSTDMAHYIEAQYPEPVLIPVEAEAAGLVHALEDWADESLYFYEMQLRFNTGSNRERNLSRMVENEAPFLRWLLPKVIPRGLGKILANQGVGRKPAEQILVDVERHVNAVSGMVSRGDFLVGDALTLADLAVHTMFTCLADADEATEILGRYPTVGQWMKRVEALTDERSEAGAND